MEIWLMMILLGLTCEQIDIVAAQTDGTKSCISGGTFGGVVAFLIILLIAETIWFLLVIYSLRRKHNREKKAIINEKPTHQYDNKAIINENPTHQYDNKAMTANPKNTKKEIQYYKGLDKDGGSNYVQEQYECVNEKTGEEQGEQYEAVEEMHTNSVYAKDKNDDEQEEYVDVTEETNKGGQEEYVDVTEKDDDSQEEYVDVTSKNDDDQEMYVEVEGKSDSGQEDYIDLEGKRASGLPLGRDTISGKDYVAMT